jgi:hypothetical protein
MFPANPALHSARDCQSEPKARQTAYDVEQELMVALADQLKTDYG